jgi:predicted enzyme related to lactoylglutathione lyase
MGRVVHFEIAADDVKRACEFYKIFGWDITDANMGEGMEYWLAKTGDEKKDGIDGAIMPREYSPNQAIRNTISVDDIEDMVKKVEAAGGKIDGDVQDIPGVGKYVNIRDTEGNQMGLLQALPRQNN